MYQRFYDLQDMPFELTPDPRYLYLSHQHREALSNLEYGLLSAKGITVLIGEAGTGKTTLLHAMLASPRCAGVNAAFISNPTLTRDEFVEVLSHQFHLGARAAQSKAALLTELNKLLRERRTAGCISALVIDEAQSLSAELLEEVRLLANSETSTQKLLPLVLVGQPELRDRLNEPGLRQLKQRITLRCEINPFTMAEATDYIATRLRTAGGDPASIFTRDAVALIFERSLGIPRTISVLCDNALLTGYGLGRRPVTRDVVVEVARDFDLTGNGPGSGASSESRFTYRSTRLEPVERRTATAEAPIAPMTAASEPSRHVASTAPASPLARWWGTASGAWHKWSASVNAPPARRPLQPTALANPPYYAAEGPFRGTPDESR